MPATVSATLAANETLARMRRSGTPVLPMAFGEAGLPVHPALREQLAAAVDRNAYGPVAGSADLRDAAAGYWARRGLAADPGLVVCGPGSKPLLYGLLLAIGGDLAVPAPSWVSYAAQARLTGRRPLFVPTRPGEGGVPDPELLAPAVIAARDRGREVRSVVLTMPDNPTGTIASARTVRRLCEVARELDLIIISDQIYRDLTFDTGAGNGHAGNGHGGGDESARTFPCPGAMAPERTVITTALSKSLALGGWRIGIAMLPDSPYGTELYGRLLGVVSEIWSSPSGPIQQAAAYAFREPPELIARIEASRRLHATVARAMAAILERAGATVPAPRGGFYVYPDFGTARAVRDHIAAAHGLTTGADLAGLLLRRYGVGALAGSEFGDALDALRLRLAVSLLYGDTDEQREESLASADPLTLPWIRAALDRADEVFTGLTAGVRAEPTALTGARSRSAVRSGTASGAASARAVPAAPAPVGAAPVDTAPVDAAPVDAAPVDAAPVDAAPVDGGAATAADTAADLAADAATADAAAA
jgi:aspartate aminotransferase